MNDPDPNTLAKMDKFVTGFRYDRGSIVDGWRITKERIGDCDDFALTLGWLYAGKSWKRLLWLMLTLRVVIWRVKSPKNGVIPRHAALWITGLGWIDSTKRTWRNDVTPHHRRWPILMPLSLLYIAMGRIPHEE